MTALLEVRGLTKVYPGVTALAGVDLDVEAGEVHCLVGQNGAGKSTLIRCVSGAAVPTSGTIRLLGQDLTAGRPGTALSAGVATIYQELDLVADLSIAANIFLGHERRIGLLLDRRTMRREAIYRRSSCLATERLEIVRTRLGDRAGVVGAAALVLDQHLAPHAVDRQLARRAAA